MRIFVLLVLIGTVAAMPYEKFKLPNGLEVIAQHDNTLPFVAVSVWYHVGAGVEKSGKTGFAHLFEHLMFQGTPHVGDDKHFAYLQEAGGSGINGTTNFDRTNYFEVVPTNELDLALWLESDRMGFLMDGVTQAKLDEQRGVVKNERRQSYDNQPYGKATEKSWQAIFPVSHPYHGRVIGSMTDLDAASLENVQAFFSQYYTPRNATLTIVGDFDRALIRSKVEKYFGTLEGGPKPRHAGIPPIQIEGPILLSETDPLATLTLLQLQYLTPPRYTNGDADFDVISHILTGNKAARLSKVLIYDQQLVQSVEAEQDSMIGNSVFSIQAMLPPDKNFHPIITIIDEQLAKLVSDPPSDEEIARAVNDIKTDRMFALQKIGGFGGRAEQFQSYNHFIGKPDWLDEDLKRYDRVTGQSIAAYAEKYLLTPNRTVLVVTPKENK